MKYKYTFLLTLIGVLPQLTVASDLDDAVNFLNGKLKECKRWQTQDLGGFYNFENYPRQEIMNSILYLDRERGSVFLQRPEASDKVDGASWEIPLSRLDYKVEPDAYIQKQLPSSSPPNYIINFECLNGEKCIKIRGYMYENGRKYYDEKMVNNGWAHLCSESNMNRAAKALGDAIRLSGGKSSKY